MAKQRIPCVGYNRRNETLKKPRSLYKNSSAVIPLYFQHKVFSIPSHIEKQHSFSLIQKATARTRLHPPRQDMGNCGFKGFAEVEDMVRVVTSSGGIMELFPPITAECITNEFPGHAIYRTPDLLSQPQPLLHNEELHAGHLYYLLPINTSFTKQSHPNDVTSTYSSMNTPYRMSFDQQRVLKRTESAEVLPRYNSSGVWKVKLVISPEQLAEILAQESRTEALIESVRTVAKCGNGVSSSVANSDQLSVSSSWKGLW